MIADDEFFIISIGPDLILSEAYAVTYLFEFFF